MITIRRMGCDYRHDKDFKAQRPNGYNCYLVLFIKTKSIINYDGEDNCCCPNTFILFNKNSPHFYRADNEEYIDDWIQFEGEDDFISRISFELDKPVYICDSIRLADYFKLIMEAFYHCRSANITDHLIKAMLLDVSELSECNVNKSAHYRELLEIRRNIYTHPEQSWTVTAMSEKIHVSEPYFQEIYKKTFGKTCIADVISSRVSAAKNLLSSTYLTAEEIAFKCGYNSAVHFSRQFKQETGIAPSKWRTKQ